ncbi:aminobenzoyl-glutamate utilization protein B [Lentibacillus halodurans]|uniref:Aminobenzoyl-glutamate utilization protein B n=1 Tax=Lentibacillus halodurans TaxID=237679 RepID=A0A1I0YBA4_9BACI|nr:M20 family metallopeptidase [Lentibacillus halodurans]SFB10584.1 aminobenzoyl-glutamate utilization protein B [Lentibacillus halodurans]
MKKFVEDYIIEHKKWFEQVSEYIYQHPETRFEEYESAEYLAKVCEEQGFIVERNVAGIETAFTATYGTGDPVIAFLGEFDALSGLSQEPNAVSYQPMERDIGHGCGHNLLGTGAFAAACATKAYLEKHHIPGTVKFFGCPGEEGGSGKTFMVREGAFEGIDAALTWHPSPSNSIMSLSSLANYQVYFKFRGVSAHAANTPHLGRSALDAVELMNIGVNYLREHIMQEARLHYAVTNTGGISPNVVQANAEVLYLIRAPKVNQVDDIFNRVKKIAEGAALMTETELTIEFDKACSNYIPNRNLEQLLYKNFKEAGVEEPAPEEIKYAKELWSTFSKSEQENYLDPMKGFGYMGDGSEFSGKYLSDSISDYYPSKDILAGSTDVADVSWVVPTAQLTSSTSALGTALHTWQMTAQGLSNYANRGMFRSAETMALTALQLFTNEENLKEVQHEFAVFREKNEYTNPIPSDVTPSKLNER